MINTIKKYLGDEASHLLDYKSKTVDKSELHLPGPDMVDRIWMPSDRSIPVLRNLQAILNTGRLAGTGRHVPR